jgi:hypothetical protein
MGHNTRTRKAQISTIHIAYDESDALAQVADTAKPAHLRAYNARQSSQWSDVWLYDTHVGYCLEDREINGYDGVVRLLKTKKFRSNFRQSMAMQVRAWLADTAPRYNTPLSPKQLRFIG